MPINIKYLQLITKQLSGQISEKESQLLQKWLSKSLQYTQGSRKLLDRYGSP